MKVLLTSLFIFLLSYIGCDLPSKWHQPNAEASYRVVLAVDNCKSVSQTGPLEEMKTQLISKLILSKIIYKNVSSNSDTKEITLDIIGYEGEVYPDKSFGQVLTETAELKLIGALHLTDAGVEEQIDSIINKENLTAIFDKNRNYNIGSVYPPAVLGISSVENYPKNKAVFEKYNNELPFQLVWQKAESYVDYNSEKAMPKYEMWLYAYKKNDKNFITNKNVVNAKAEPSPYTGMIEIIFNMDSKGAKEFEDMTTIAAKNNNREILILINNEVVSAPRVNSPISGGSASISGAYSLQEATRIAGLLSMPELACEVSIKEEILLAK